MNYTQEELKNYLIKNYSLKSKDEILKETNLSWNYIQKKCCLFKIKRNFNESNKSFSNSRILLYDNLSCYWIGFILADGHVSKHRNIQINLAIKDKEHLLKIKDIISNFIMYEDEQTIRLLISDIPTIDKLSKDFQIKSNKTKNPPIIPSFLSKEQIFSMVIGFIDGDGHIDKKGKIIIKCDKSWEDLLAYFYNILTDKNKKIIKEDRSYMIVGRYDEVLKIKNKAILLNLPLMERKWNRIVNKIMRYEKYQIVENLLKNNKSINDIKYITNFSYSLIYTVKSNLNK